MFVVRIHITTTFAGFHIDQIELYHTGDGAVSLIAIFVFFFHQFKEYPRSLSHHVLAGSHVAGTLVHTLVFEFQVSCAVIGGQTGIETTICFTRIGKFHVRGNGSQQVYHIVDTEVVTMDFRRIVRRFALVERYFFHTVDGILGIVHDIGYTVLCAIKHDTATEHTAEIGTLDGVQHTTGRERTFTVDIPFGLHALFYIEFVVGKEFVVRAGRAAVAIVDGIIDSAQVENQSIARVGVHASFSIESPFVGQVVAVHLDESVEHGLEFVFVNFVGRRFTSNGIIYVRNLIEGEYNIALGRIEQIIETFFTI